MPRRTAEDAAATRQHLLDVARSCFGAEGWAGTSVDDIAARAGVTKGAVYHHFADKKALFVEVYGAELVTFDQTVGAAGMAEAERTGDLWRAFAVGIETYLDLCLDREVMQIILLDPPSVLGYDEWQMADATYASRQIGGMLELLMSVGQIAEQPIEPLADVLVGAFNQAGRAIATAEDPQEVRGAMGEALHALVQGLRVRDG